MTGWKYNILMISLLMLWSCGPSRSGNKSETEEAPAISQQEMPPQEMIACDSAITQEVDTPPLFPDGDQALAMYFYKTLRIPNPHRSLEKTGTISFVVDCNGRAKDFRAVSSIHADVDRIIEYAVLKMPAWNAAVKDGQAVNHRVCFRVQVVRGSTAFQPQDCD
ncbi:MAG: hypothetical protein WD077_03165 [Bacteroidia bacterium]